RQDGVKGLKAGKPAATDSQQFAKRIAQLDDDGAQVREEATEELKGLGQAAEPAMRQALEKSPSAEVDFRLKLLLSHLSGEAPRTIHLIRAIEVLEHQAGPEAQQLLDELAKDSKEAIKNEAQDSLARL